jgi:hypothetical protein
MTPTAEELASLWLYTYSRASLLEAESWIDVLSASAADSTPVARALSCSIVVSYARPFTKSQVTKDKRVIPLGDVEPPHELASTHCIMLKLRDKVIGHKDAIPAAGDSVTPNIVLLKRDSCGFDIHTVIVTGVDLDLLTELKSLCTFLSRIVRRS